VKGKTRLLLISAVLILGICFSRAGALWGADSSPRQTGAALDGPTVVAQTDAAGQAAPAQDQTPAPTQTTPPATPSETKTTTPDTKNVPVTEVEVKGKRELSIGEKPDEEGHKDYVVTGSTAGSKAELPNNAVAQTVVTVPAKLLEDQDLRSVTDALKNVAGVTNTYPGYYALDQMTSMYIRGFQVSQTLRDGLWDPTPFGNSWMGDVERVEVLKGPAGLLYGAYSGSIGGVINVVTKKPLTDPSYSLMGRTDSFGSASVLADVSQPLNKDKTWLLRVNGEYGQYQSFPDRSSYQTRPFSIILQGLLTPDDAITLSYEKRWQDTHPYSGTPGYGQVGSGAGSTLARFGDYSTRLNIYDPRSDWKYDSDTERLVYQHQFNPDWSFRTSNQYTETSRDALSITATPAFQKNGTVKFTESYQEIKMGPVFALDTDNMVHGQFTTFGIKNNLISGVRFARDFYNMNMYASTNSFSSYSFTSPDNPSWDEPVKGVRRSMMGNAEIDQLNYYINDVISLTEKLKLSAGINYVDYSLSSQSGMPGSKLSQTHYSDSGNGWRVGLLYDVLPGLTPFADYSTTFLPQNPNTTNDGHIQTFNSLSGEQIEAGVKVDIAKRASVTASIYQIRLKNVLATNPDPTLATLGYKVQTGEQMSQGVELDGTYKLMPGWDLLTAYAHTNAHIESDGTYQSGSKVPNVPDDSLRLWSVYELQSGRFAGLGFGGGMTAASSRETNLVAKATPNLVASMGGYAVFDALVYYRFQRYNHRCKLSLNITNLFDHSFWQSATSYGWLYAGEPFKAVVRLQVAF